MPPIKSATKTITLSAVPNKRRQTTPLKPVKLTGSGGIQQLTENVDEEEDEPEVVVEEVENYGGR